MKIRQSLTAIAAGAGAFIAVGLTVSAMSAAATASPGETINTPYAGSYAVAALDSPVVEPVVLPKYLDPANVGTKGLDVDSVRVLSSENGTTYYVGLSRMNELCFIIGLPGDISGSSCTTPEDFKTMALAVRVQGPGNVAEGYVVPDGISPQTENLVTVDPLLSTAGRSQEQSIEGYNLAPLGPMDDDDVATLEATATN
jgi:hypothetical protein